MRAWFEAYYLIVLIVVLPMGVLLGVFWVMTIQRIHKHSEKLRALIELNRATVFHQDVLATYKLVKHLNNKRQFERFNCRKYALSQVIRNLAYYQKLAEKTAQNKQRYDQYMAAFMHVYEGPSNLVKQTHRLRRWFDAFERRTLRRTSLPKPRLSTALRIDARYTSPKGQNRYKKWQVYETTSFLDLLAYAKEEHTYRQTRAYHQKTERSKMSASLRFDVLKRDAYRCRICGRSTRQDPGLILHVDHIEPVAKGGHTVMENLQTLCQSCNLGKSTKRM